MNFNKNVLDVVENAINSRNGIKLPSLISEMEKEGISALDTGIAVDFLVKENKVIETKGFLHNINKNIGDNMESKNNSAKLKLTEEQAGFRDLVCKKKATIYKKQEEGAFLVHRGVQIAFAGCGEKAFRYRIALDLGLSDKEPVETIVRYLDWDDTALYDEGGIADQLRDALGTPLVQDVELKPVKIELGGK